MSKNFENIDLITYIYQSLKVQLTFKQRGFGYTRISFSINIVGVSTKTCILCRYVVRILSRDFATNQTTSKGRLKKKKKTQIAVVKRRSSRLRLYYRRCEISHVSSQYEYNIEYVYVYVFSLPYM